jgi:hypothetical protein
MLIQSANHSRAIQTQCYLLSNFIHLKSPEFVHLIFSTLWTLSYKEIYVIKFMIPSSRPLFYACFPRTAKYTCRASSLDGAKAERLCFIKLTSLVPGAQLITQVTWKLIRVCLNQISRHHSYKESLHNFQNMCLIQTFVQKCFSTPLQWCPCCLFWLILPTFSGICSIKTMSQLGASGLRL